MPSILLYHSLPPIITLLGKKSYLLRVVSLLLEQDAGYAADEKKIRL